MNSESSPAWLTYWRRGWLALWSLPALTGAVTSLGGFGYRHTVVLIGVTWLVALGLGCVVADSAKITKKRMRMATYCAVSMISIIGLGRLGGGVMGLIVLLAVLTHPGVVRPIWRHTRRILAEHGWPPDQADRIPTKAAPHLSSGSPVVDPRGFRTLTRTELSLAWQATHADLESARQRHREFHGRHPMRRDCILCGHLLQDQVLIINQRRDCLDEIERRSAVALRRWLSSAVDPDSDPTRYLDDQPRRHR